MTLKRVAAAFAAAIVGFSATANAQPADFVDLGNIGAAGNFVFDTTGSTNITNGGNLDTEIGLFDSSGILLDNDDDGLGFPFSVIDIDLAPGEYFVAISEFDSIFADGFSVTGTQFEAGESGEAVLNINGLLAASLVIGDAATTGLLEVAFFRFEIGDADVIPLPAAFPLFLAGLAGLRIAGRKKKTA